jgi:nucleotide-binding universal stress UspA family protein
MSLATIMVYVGLDSLPEQRISTAATLAARFNAALVGFSAQGLPEPFVAEGVVIEETTKEDIARLTDEFDRKGTWFRKVASRPDAEWRWALEFPTEALMSRANAADLIVIGPVRSSHIPYGLLAPGRLILNAGRPVLFVPDGVAALAANHVVIGWKNTREARRAVLDALPFLRAAGRVSIVEVHRDTPHSHATAATDDLVQYLARHAIKAQPHNLRHRDGSEADDLIHFALREKADLLVTGAYGHSRLGEWIFGGMTKDLLDRSPICCLMSH